MAPQCRAVLVSTTPAPENGGSYYASCSEPANPHVPQHRLAGYIEGTITDLRDQAKPGVLVCTPSPVKNGLPVCVRGKDQLVEKLCNETRVYDCPCGVESASVDGGLAGYCRGVPR